MNIKKEDNRLKINYQIKSPTVKLVGENVKIGVYSITEAIKIADDLNLDLVEVSPSQIPPICRIVDYEKFLYDKKKNEKKPDQVKTKELKFRPVTDEHDFNFKLKHAQSFLEKGDRVKALVFFKGREMMYKNQGKDILDKLTVALEGYGIIDAPIRMEGNKMFMFFRPKKK
jgi:translation initiation factor IF-3